MMIFKYINIKICLWSLEYLYWEKDTHKNTYSHIHTHIITQSHTLTHTYIFISILLVIKNIIQLPYYDNKRYLKYANGQLQILHFHVTQLRLNVLYRKLKWSLVLTSLYYDSLIIRKQCEGNSTENTCLMCAFWIVINVYHVISRDVTWYHVSRL